MSINNDELEIFSRQLILNDFDEKSFIKLQKKKVSIVGLGGIGCPLAQYLISSGIKHLNIFDNDIIKKNNLNRQSLYSINDLGEKKSFIAKKKLLETNPYADIKNFDEKITKKNISLLDKSSIIIDASDNLKTMRLTNSFATRKNIPLISASVIGFDIQILLLENSKRKHLCLECIFPNKKEVDLARCDTVGILGTTAGIAGLISAQKTINFFMNFDNNKNILSLFDCKTLTINHIKIDTNTECKQKI